MTPRPSDEAREALRAARDRENTEQRQPTGTPASREQGPADAAREALRRALRARSAHAAGGGEAITDEQAGTGTRDRALEATAPGDPVTDDDGGGASAPGEGSAGGVHASEEQGAPAPAASRVTDVSDGGAGAGGEKSGRPVPETGGPPAQRPGDIAREALRSARAEALRARRAAEGRGADDTRQHGRSTPPAPSRSSRTTGGHRVAEARAREVREALADAFRMPASVDEPDRGTDDTRRTGEGRSAPALPDSTGAPGPSHGGGTARPAAGGSREPGRSAPSTPYATPRSMAAPTRDSDLRRTFPAFPARPPGEGTFAETWWGNAWVTALEEGALDAARLARGRGYAEQGNVDAITVTPGLVLAYVQGSRPRPYRVQVRLRTFTDADWERFLDAAADRPGHIAALLDKEMPQSLADCGVPLLPGPGDLDPHCSCPDRGHPCKHAAALCYQTARLLDADPFVLLLLRGRGERTVIDALSRLSAARAARAAQGKEPEPLPGVRASDLLAGSRGSGGVLPPLPAPLPPPPHPEQPPVYPPAPGGPDPFALDQLATDAAARAHALLTTGRDPVGGLTLWQDAVRLAAARPGSGLTAATRSLYASLAKAADRSPAELARAVAAWRQGGLNGLRVLEEPWDPPAGRFDRARPLLLAADLPAFRPWRNRLTHPRGHVQLRLGRDHLWYAYESEPGHDDWWPRGTPDSDPVGALTGLDTPGAL
ncbi:SWIM zinc finger family protein [Streptomyces sp. NPDC052013]|uniref:SWIM zinc finger family protein n=1 Tax=Streptomyces sp. NPDC052013 TaxID=3365679 RepID=UPI0037D7B89E